MIISSDDEIISENKLSINNKKEFSKQELINQELKESFISDMNFDFLITCCIDCLKIY